MKQVSRWRESYKIFSSNISKDWRKLLSKSRNIYIYIYT